MGAKKNSIGRNSTPSKMDRIGGKNKPDFGAKSKKSVEIRAIHAKRNIKITSRNTTNH